MFKDKTEMSTHMTSTNKLHMIFFWFATSLNKECFTQQRWGKDHGHGESKTVTPFTLININIIYTAQYHK